MQDMIGSAGMLRGWAAMWTMQMMWSAAAMMVALGVTAILELLFTRRTADAPAALALQEPAAAAVEIERLAA